MPPPASSSIVRDAEAALVALGVRVARDAGAPSLAACHVDPGGATLLLSERAKRAYDPEHPERIAAFLVRRADSDSDSARDFLVLVRDREYADVHATVRHWWTSERVAPSRATECGICLLARHAKMYCCGECHAMLCPACRRKTTSSDNAHRCPVCRRWSLDGPWFGRPAAELGTVDVDLDASRDPVDAFLAVLAALDGEVTVIPRVDDEYLLGSAWMTGRYPLTARYLPGAKKLRDVAPRLRRLAAACGRTGATLLIYTVRRTYAVDADRGPVDELSVFRVAGHGLQQYAPEAYLDVLDVVFASSETMGPRARVKVAYVAPEPFPLRPDVEALLRGMAGAGESRTLSVTGQATKKTWNCDLDVGWTSGAPATMSTEMFRALVAASLDRRERVVLLNLVHAYGDGSRNSDVEGYELPGPSPGGPREWRRLSPDECRRVVAANADGLRGTRRIVRYL